MHFNENEIITNFYNTYKNSKRMSWYVKDSSLYTWLPDSIIHELKNITKVASFDLDWTLVKPRYAKFPVNFEDNVIMDNRINTLKKYIDSGYTIVIFSNQKVTNKESVEYKLKRMNDVIAKFSKHGITIILMMATKDDKYRKPEIGMLNEFKLGAPNAGLSVSFYCGDAAGRPNDFSDSDLQFAKNIGITFYIPEQIFN